MMLFMMCLADAAMAFNIFSLCFSSSPAGGQRKEKHLNVGFNPGCLTLFIKALTQSDLSLCDTSIILNGKSKYGGLQYSMADREHSLWLAKSSMHMTAGEEREKASLVLQT